MRCFRNIDKQATPLYPLPLMIGYFVFGAAPTPCYTFLVNVRDQLLDSYNLEPRNSKSPPPPLVWRVGLQSFATFWQFLVALLTLPMALTLAEAFSPHTMDTPFIMGVGGAMLYAIIKLL